jgi:hypothetical protein
MPAIKKRITAAFAEAELQADQKGTAATSANGAGDAVAARKAPIDPAVDESAKDAASVSPVKKKPATPTTSMLKGLDGEVLVEKRKRTLNPAEQKLDTWWVLTMLNELFVTNEPFASEANVLPLCQRLSVVM